MTLEKLQKNKSEDSKIQQNNKYNAKEAMAIAISAMDANEINRQGRLSEKARADSCESYIQELLGVIQEQQSKIAFTQPEKNTIEEYDTKLNNFMKSEDPRIKEIEERKIKEMMDKQKDYLRSRYNYSKLLGIE
jgi:hypothetical protein